MMAATQLLRCWLLGAVGRIAEVTAQLDLLVRFVEQPGSPVYRVHLGWGRTCLLLLAGRWAEADAISRATCDLHSGMSSFSGPLRLGGGSLAQAIRIYQRWEAAYLAGTGAELVDELRAAAEATGSHGLRSILTMGLVEARLAWSAQHPDNGAGGSRTPGGGHQSSLQLNSYFCGPVKLTV
jgi:hypothetical protein